MMAVRPDRWESRILPEWHRMNEWRDIRESTWAAIEDFWPAECHREVEMPSFAGRPGIGHYIRSPHSWLGTEDCIRVVCSRARDPAGHLPALSARQVWRDAFAWILRAARDKVEAELVLVELAQEDDPAPGWPAPRHPYWERCP